MDLASKEFLKLYSLLLEESRDYKKEYRKKLLRSNDPVKMFYYAKDIIKGRWPEAEEFIKKDPYHACEYALDIIKGRWPEAEEFIKKDPEWACEYALDIIKGRWPEAEKFIKKDTEIAYLYARNVIKFIKKENVIKFIKKNAEWACEWAYDYARRIIKGRWPEAEEFIKKDPEYAYYYAKDIIGGRWPEAEEFIKKDPEYACEYAKEVIKGRWPEAEESIYEEGYEFDYLNFLVKLCMKKGRRKDLEELFLKEAEKEDGHGVIPYQYAKNVIKGRWIELEKIKINETMYWNKYLKLICKECNGDGVISLGIGGADEECSRCNGGGFDPSKI